MILAERTPTTDTIISNIINTSTMRKILILNTFLLTTLLVLLTVVVSTISSHQARIDRIAPSTEELKEKARKMGLLRLSENEVKDICLRLNNELLQLNILKKTFTLSIILLLAFTLFGIYKFNLKVSRFDGLCLLVLSLLLIGLDWLVDQFSGVFYGGHNASISIWMLFGTFIILPILFYIAFRLNNKELNLRLHEQKWISFIAFTLTIISLLLALIIGIAALLTPDVSSFKN
jgi:hypothetical protein